MTTLELATAKAEELFKELEPMIRLNELEKDAIKCQLKLAFINGAASILQNEVDNILKS